TLKCSRELKLKTVEFYPAQYSKLKQALKDMAYDSRKNVILGLNKKNIPDTLVVSDVPEPPVDSNARILSDEKTLTVTGPHTAVYRVKYSKRILTYEGKIREAEVKVSYNPSCEHARIIHATVISRDGTRQEISPGEINVMDQGWNSGARRYTGGKVLVASLPGVEIGSTIEVEFEITMKGVPFISGFEPFQFPDDLNAKSFVLTAPKGLKIEKLVSGPRGIVREHDSAAGGNRTFEWKAEGIKPLPSEPDLPPEWNYQAGVEYFIGNPADYWKALSEAMLDHSRHDSSAAALAKRLAAAGKTKLEKLKAIRDFIAENIRLAGPSFTALPLRELSDADTTLNDGYGHSADCAILYYAMLDAAGFRPQFVMASDLPPVRRLAKVAGSFPLPDEFQSPLVKVSVDGRDYYFNDTDQYSRLGTTASNGKLALALPEQKKFTVRVPKGDSNRIQTDYAVSLNDDGNAQIEISRWFYGQAFNENNEFFSELPPEQRRHYFQDAVSRVAQGARPVGGLTTKFDTYPGLERFTVRLDNFAVADGKYFYFNLPFTASLFSELADHRALPLFISDADENDFRAEIQLPSGFQMTGIAPKNEKLVAPGGSEARISEANDHGKCVVTEKFDTRPGIIKPGKYLDLLNIQAALGEKSARTFLLEKK
ncbi:MAG: DUF3857 domain-containing protein, partial [Limisphaerales bacterium]